MKFFWECKTCGAYARAENPPGACSACGKESPTWIGNRERPVNPPDARASRQQNLAGADVFLKCALECMALATAADLGVPRRLIAAEEMLRQARGLIGMHL